MPRYRTRTGVVIDTSPEAAGFLGAEQIGGGDPPQAEPTAVTEAEPVAPASPDGGPAEPVQEPPAGTDAAEPVQPAPETAEMTAAAPPPSPESLDADDYEQWTTVELREEMRRRNRDREEADRLHTSQDKADLIADLRADDGK
jgi:hypothetical protein